MRRWKRKIKFDSNKFRLVLLSSTLLLKGIKTTNTALPDTPIIQLFVDFAAFVELIFLFTRFGTFEIIPLKGAAKALKPATP